MPIINIPQGQVGYISHAPNARLGLDMKLEGLFTSKFSSCTIVAVYSKKIIALAHVDQFFPEEGLGVIFELIKKEKEVFEVIVFYRESYQDRATVHVKNLQDHYTLKNNPYLQKLTRYVVPNHFDGILLTQAENPKYSVHPHIQFYKPGILPQALMRHPDEQKIETIRKMETVLLAHIPVGSFIFTKAPNFIFTEFFWCSFSAVVFNPKEDPENKKILERISIQTGESVFAIAQRLQSYLTELKDADISLSCEPEQMAIHFVPNFEWYARNYEDPFELFKWNLGCLLHGEGAKSYLPPEITLMSNEDKALAGKLSRNFLQTPEITYAHIMNLITAYKENAPTTLYKVALLEHVKTLSDAYLDRMPSFGAKKERKKKLEFLTSFCSQGTKEFQQKNYDRAQTIFEKCLQHLYLYSLPIKNAGNFASTLYNFGRSQQRMGEQKESQNSDAYKKAINCFDLALSLVVINCSR